MTADLIPPFGVLAICFAMMCAMLGFRELSRFIRSPDPWPPYLLGGGCLLLAAALSAIAGIRHIVAC